MRDAESGQLVLRVLGLPIVPSGWVPVRDSVFRDRRSVSGPAAVLGSARARPKLCGGRRLDSAGPYRPHSAIEASQCAAMGGDCCNLSPAWGYGEHLNSTMALSLKLDFVVVVLQRATTRGEWARPTPATAATTRGSESSAPVACSRRPISGRIIHQAARKRTTTKTTDRSRPASARDPVADAAIPISKTLTCVSTNRHSLFRFLSIDSIKMAASKLQRV